MAAPTLVQAIHTGQDANNGANGTPNCTLAIKFPNLSLASNLLVLCFSYDPGIGTVTSVTDNTGSNTWVKFTTGSGSAGQLAIEIWYVAGATAGVQAVTVQFSGHPSAGNSSKIWANFSEWYNVATSSPTDGGNVALGATSSPYAAGSFTPTVDGDLILCYGVPVPNSGTGNATGITAGASFTLLGADILAGSFTNTTVAEYFIQPSHGAINPGFSTPGNTDQTLNVSSVAFKAASAGTAPTISPRIVTVHHQYLGVAPRANMPMPCPASITGIVVSLMTNNTFPLSISDSVNGAYTIPASARAKSTVNDICQLAYRLNATGSPTLQMTFSLGSPVGDPIACIYTTVGLTNFDTGAGTMGDQEAPGTLTGVTIQPARAGAFVFSTLAISWNTINGVSVAGETGILQSVVNANLQDGISNNSTLDEDNGHAYFVASSGVSRTFSWIATTTDTHAGGGMGVWSSAAASFVSPPPPVQTPFDFVPFNVRM